jgi:TPR repeat protein
MKKAPASTMGAFAPVESRDANPDRGIHSDGETLLRLVIDVNAIASVAERSARSRKRCYSRLGGVRQDPCRVRSFTFICNLRSAETTSRKKHTTLHSVAVYLHSAHEGAPALIVVLRRQACSARTSRGPNDTNLGFAECKPDVVFGCTGVHAHAEFVASRVSTSGLWLQAQWRSVHDVCGLFSRGNAPSAPQRYQHSRWKLLKAQKRSLYNSKPIRMPFDCIETPAAISPAMKSKYQSTIILAALFIAAAIAAALYIYLHHQATPPSNVAPTGKLNAEQLEKPPIPRDGKLHLSDDASPSLGGTALADVIDTAKSEAKSGNAAIAYSLFKELRQCLFLDRQLDDLKNDVNSNGVSNKSASAQLDSLDAKIKRCEGISEETAKSYLDWLDLAARSGNTDAQVAYITEFGLAAQSESHRFDTAWLEDYKSKSIRYLQSASSGGDVNAMLALATTYWAGDLVPQDKVSAYAYWYAVAESGLVPQSERALPAWESQMTQEEVERARRLGDSLLSNCCN